MAARVWDMNFSLVKCHLSPFGKSEDKKTAGRVRPPEPSIMKAIIKIGFER